MGNAFTFVMRLPGYYIAATDFVLSSPFFHEGRKVEVAMKEKTF